MRMSIISEFKEFAVKGNMIDLAVAVIIGGAFGKIVDSLVKDVVMPVIGLALGGIDFRGLFISLGKGSYATLAEAEKAGAAVLKYGSFLQTVVDFLIIAWIVFIAIKAINKLKRDEPAAPAAPAAPPEDIVLLREIRDALKK
jgi:large conductance mechanosensitive channel